MTVGGVAALAISETDTLICVGALRELGAAGFRAGVSEITARFEGLDVLDVYVLLAGSDDVEVRAALAELLPDSGLAERELVLALLVARGDIGAHRLLVRELMSSDPSAVCELVAEAPTWLEDDSEELLLAHARNLSGAALLEGLAEA